MGRTELPDAIVQDVSEILAEDLRAAGAELLSADLDGIEVRLQAMSRRVCGAIMARVAAVRAIPRGARPPCPAWGAAAVGGPGADAASARAGRRCGHRPADRCLHADGVRARLCALGCGTGLGAETLLPRLARAVGRAAISGAVAEAATQLREEHGVVVGGETVRRVTEAVGAVAEAARHDAIARARQGR